MSYSADAVVNGLISYADNEVMVKLPTSGKWIMGTVMGIATTKVTKVAEVLQTNPIANMLEIVDENGNIDVDAIVNSMRESADRYGNLTLDVPFVGKMTFTASDVDRLRTYFG